MLKKLLAMLAAGYAIGQWVAYRQHHASKAGHDTASRKPDEVSNWEGEGGALPVSGAQLGPAPAKP